MDFTFDASQPHQLEAIESVVGLFDGQATVDTGSGGNGLSLLGEIPNGLTLGEPTILENLQRVQDRNGLEIQSALHRDGLEFDIDMETGTGKTYVYLRTIFELNQKYGFSKFIILVPSVAIREGVKTSVSLMTDHFGQIYATPFEFSVYSGERAEEVQSFATATSLQVMLITIDSLKGDKNNRIMHQRRDKLGGQRPIDYLAATRPVLIMDEPQNMESDLSQTSLAELNRSFTLRYSATHKVERNLVYRLDPIDALDQGLVKQIVVSEVQLAGADAQPYMKLLEVKREPFRAKLELACRSADGTVSRKAVTLKQGDDLAKKSKNEAYANDLRLNEISIDPPRVEISNHGYLEQGEMVGGANDAVLREMIRETIREHLRREAQFRDRGIKVLTLFFVDRVDNYVAYTEDGSKSDGKFAKWFDELFIEERDKSGNYRDLLPQDPQELRSAYFAVTKTRGVEQYVDSSGTTKKDDDAYNLIMRDKTRLLDSDEPVRFIFSHSALREGWDNPNVFQICALREVGVQLERRQMIGRGLRLPVDQSGERVSERELAQLSVVASESYTEFAAGLQKDYEAAGVSIGRVRKGEFGRLKTDVDGEEVPIGYASSLAIWEHLVGAGFLTSDGIVSKNFAPENDGFTMNLPDEFGSLEEDVTRVLEKCRLENHVKSARKRRSRKLNKQLYSSPEFVELWKRISARTTYSVALDRKKIIEQSVAEIKAADTIEPIRINVTRAGVRLERGGAKTDERGSRTAGLESTFPLPDIVRELQAATSLTGRTVVEILAGCGRIDEFIANPNDFIRMARTRINQVVAGAIADGIQYEKIDGSVYELTELLADGEAERDRFIDNLYEVKNREKTDFDFVEIDSTTVERKFAELLDSRDDVVMFMKLPAKFLVPTPVGDYNPDWAIVKKDGESERIYMIRETKSTLDRSLLRPKEKAKIEFGEKHFDAIGIDYADDAPPFAKL